MPRVLSVALVLLVPALLTAQPRSSKSKPIPATPQEYTQLKTMDALVGVLAKFDVVSSGNKTFSLDVPYAYPVTKSNRSAIKNSSGQLPYSGLRSGQSSYASQLASLERQYQKALTTKNAAQREQKVAQVTQKIQQLKEKMAAKQTQQQIQQQTQQQKKVSQHLTAQARHLFGATAANAAYIAIGFKNFEMEGLDNMVVRRQNPPLRLDDNGKPKPYTNDELKGLKGKDKSLPGYEATLLDLSKSQVVKAYLVNHSKPADNGQKAAAANHKDAAEVDVGKKGVSGSTVTSRPQIRMLLILAEVDE
jgi:hypothetical protein